MLIALILVGVEPNHGPACNHQTRHLCRQQRTVRSLNIGNGLVNTRSAVNKAAELHAVIHENLLDILVVVETWFQPDTPETIALDVAPPGFKVIGVPRSDGHRSGGLAVIYRDRLGIISASIPFSSKSFEMQTIQLAVSGEHFMIMGIYRPSSTNLEMFFDELADLFDATASAATRFSPVISTVPEIHLKPSMPAHRHCYRATMSWPWTVVLHIFALMVGGACSTLSSSPRNRGASHL